MGYRQILATYYPGTALSGGSDDRPIRVEISADNDGQVDVVATPGLALTVEEVVTALPRTLAAQPVLRWRARLLGTLIRVEGLTGGADPLWRMARAADTGRIGFRAAPGAAVRLVLPRWGSARLPRHDPSGA